MSLHSTVPLHALPFACPRVTLGARSGCVRDALPGCASRVLAIGGAHLLSVPGSRARPVGATQSDRVPEMPSRRLVASAPIRPMVKLPVRVRRRRRLHPVPCRLSSRSEPARGRLLHDFAHSTSRSEALTPLAPRRAFATRCGRIPSAPPDRSVPSAAMHATTGAREGGGADLRVRGGGSTGGTGSMHCGSSSRWSGGRPSHPHPEIESPGSAASGLREWAPSRHRCSLAPGDSPPVMDQLLPTIHAIVASSPSSLCVALFAAASRSDPWIDRFATVWTERHRRILTPVIPVRTPTLRHEPLSRLP